MTEKPESEQKQKIVGGDLVIPVAAVVFTIYYFISIIDAPWTAQVGAVFIGSILILLCALFLFKQFKSVFVGEARWAWGKLVLPGAYIPKRLALLALTVIYIVALPWAGFTLTGFVYLYAAMLVLGGPRVKWPALFVSLAFALGGYLLFVVAFQVRFPQGPFEYLMKGLF
jgi:hypothetical protein